MTGSDAKPRSSMYKAAFRNLVISAAGSVLTYLSFMLVAYMFGATAQTDVFMFASSFVVAASGLVTTVFGAIFLPLYIKLQHGDDGADRSAAFANSFLFRLLILAASGAGLIYFFPIQLFSAFSKFNTAVLVSNVRLLEYFSIVFALSVLNEYFRMLLQAREAFVPAAFSIVVQPAVNVVLVWLLAGPLGYESLAIAAAVSRILQCGFLLWHVQSRGFGLKPAVARNRDIGDFLRIAKPYWLASTITVASGFFFDYVASGLPPGTLTAVVFAQKMYLLPISLLALPVIEVLNTRLSMLYAMNDIEALGKLYSTSVKFAVISMLPIGVLIAFNASEITEILLSRGAYSEESLSITARSLAVFAMAIPCMALFSINGRVSLVLQKTRMPSLFGSIGHLIMMGTVWTMVDAFGYIGLSTSKLLVEAIYFLPFGFIVARYYLPGINFQPIIVEVMKIIFAACISLALMFWLARATSLGGVAPLLFIIWSSLGFILMFYAVSRMTGLDSLKLLNAALGKISQ